MALLFPLGVLLIPFTIGCATIYIWLRAITLLCQAKFIAGSIWLCIGIAILNFFFGDGTSFVPLYIANISAAIVAQAWKYSRTRTLKDERHSRLARSYCVERN